MVFYFVDPQHRHQIVLLRSAVLRIIKEAAGVVFFLMLGVNDSLAIFFV